MLFRSTAHLHDERPDRLNYSYTSAFNLTGWPGVVIPVCKDENNLPIGIQILSQSFREDICLAVARAIEASLNCYEAMKPAIYAESA